MKKEVSLIGQRFELLPLLFVTIGIIILILLGNWQIDRLVTKENFIQTIETNIVNPSITLSKVSEEVSFYSKIEIAGHFRPNKDIFLYGKRSASPEKDGYYLLSAFEADNGKIYAVSRGWLPHSARKNVENFIPHKQETIQAIVLPGEKKPFVVPENDRKNNIWFTLDLDMSNEVIGTTEKNFYLMQIDSDRLPEGAKPLRTTHLNKVRNDHMEYAITWYSLAACLLIIFVIHSRKKS